MHAALLHSKLWASCITCVAISLVWAPEVLTLAVVSRGSIDFVDGGGGGGGGGGS